MRFKNIYNVRSLDVVKGFTSIKRKKTKGKERRNINNFNFFLQLLSKRNIIHLIILFFSLITEKKKKLKYISRNLNEPYEKLELHTSKVPNNEKKYYELIIYEDRVFYY